MQLAKTFAFTAIVILASASLVSATDVNSRTTHQQQLSQDSNMLGTCYIKNIPGCSSL